VADENRVEDFVPQPSQSRRDADGFGKMNFRGAIGGECFSQPSARAV
jgi:hypothetical protein